MTGWKPHYENPGYMPWLGCLTSLYGEVDMALLLTINELTLFVSFSVFICTLCPVTMTTMALCLSQSYTMSSLMYIEGRRVVAEALATTCAVNTNLKQVGMTNLHPLPVLKSLTNRRAPLDELVVKKKEFGDPWISFMILHPLST